MLPRTQCADTDTTKSMAFRSPDIASRADTERKRVRADSTLVHIQLTHEAAEFAVFEVSRQYFRAEPVLIVHCERVLLLVVPRNDVRDIGVIQYAPEMTQELSQWLLPSL